MLSNQCESLTGSLGRGFGYFIQRRRNKKGEVRFFSQRSKHQVPPDGHWKMICACANMANMRLHIADIKLHWTELYDALYKAYHFTAADHVGTNGREAVKLNYNARDIINLKHTFGL